MKTIPFLNRLPLLRVALAAALFAPLTLSAWPFLDFDDPPSELIPYSFFAWNGSGWNHHQWGDADYSNNLICLGNTLTVDTLDFKPRIPYIIPPPDGMFQDPPEPIWAPGIMWVGFGVDDEPTPGYPDDYNGTLEITATGALRSDNSAPSQWDDWEWNALVIGGGLRHDFMSTGMVTHRGTISSFYNITINNGSFHVYDGAYVGARDTEVGTCIQGTALMHVDAPTGEVHGVNLRIAYEGVGTFDLLNGDATYENLYFGQGAGELSGGVGTFTQSGGTAAFDFSDIYSSQSSEAHVNVNGGSFSSDAVDVHGHADQASLIQTGGAITVSGTVTVGGTGESQYDNNGYMEISGGTFDAASLAIGGSNNAQCLIHGNAVVDVGGDILVGRIAGTQGSLQIYGDASVTCDSLQVLRGSGVTQNTGANTLNTGGLVVENGHYNLWGGAINNTGDTIIGGSAGGTAFFHHDSGTINGGVLQIQQTAGGTAQYTLEGDGVADFTEIRVGVGGSGTLTLQGTYAEMTGGTLYIATGEGSQGTLNLAGSALNVTTLTTGAGHGDGFVEQTGGNVNATTVATTLADGSAGYWIRGGALNADTVDGVTLLGGTVTAGHLGYTADQGSNGQTDLRANEVIAAGDMELEWLRLGIDGRPDHSLASSFDGDLDVTFNMTVGSAKAASVEAAGQLQIGGSLILSNGSSLETMSALAPAYVHDSTQIGMDGTAASLALRGALTTGSLELGVNAALTDASTGGMASLTFHTLSTVDDVVNLDWTSPVSVGLDGQTGAGSLTMSGGTLNALRMTVGFLSDAAATQTGGSVHITENLKLGASGCTGTYNLGGSGLLFAHDLTVGAQGTGNFHQTGGWAQLMSGSVVIGKDAGSTGAYVLESGNLDAQTIEVGAAGTGTMTQSGGRVRVSSGTVSLGTSTGSTGSYELSGSAYMEVGTLNVGGTGTGTFVMNDTTLLVNTALNLGAASGGSGLFTFNSGTVDVTTGTVNLGVVGTGRLNMVGGLIGDTTSRTLTANVLDFGANGTLQSSGFNNTLRVNEILNMPNSFNFVGALEIGHWGGTGNVVLGGVQQLSATTVAVGAGNEGTLTLGGTSGLSTNLLEVGDMGTGHIVQNAGTVNVLDEIDVGGTWAGGSYLMAGGTLDSVDAALNVGTGGGTGSFTIGGGMACLDTITVGGAASSGTFTFNGGLVVTEAFAVGAGGTIGSSGTTAELRTNALTFDGGAFALTGIVSIGHSGGGGMGLAAGQSFSSGTLVVGYNDSGTYDQSGGTATVSGTLRIGGEAAGDGTLTLSGGVLTAANTTVGGSGHGEITVGNANHSTTNYLIVGDVVGSAGTYRLNAGGNTQASTEFIGYSGAGTFLQTGGSNAATGLYLATGATSSGEYRLSGGELLLSSGIYVGNFGNGQMVQDGGSASSLALYLGHLADSTGHYTMSGGSLSSGTQYVGYSGTGRFIQTGGTNSSGSTHLYVGRNAAGNGTYELGGTGVLGTNYTYVGYGSTGVFQQTAGTHTVQYTLALGTSSNKTGSYSMSGGTLTSSDIYVGDRGIGQFVQTDGTAAATNITLGLNAGSNGTFEIGGGTLSADTLWVGKLGNGTLNIKDASSHITVSNTLKFGGNGNLSAVPGSTIHMTGSAFVNESIDPADLVGMENLGLIFEGGADDLDPFEVAGRDFGAIAAGFDLNFALGTLELGGADIGRVQLVSNFDNQPSWIGTEALYVWNLVVHPGSTLDLNGFDLYYGTFTGDLGNISFNGGSFSQVVPEPATHALLLAAAAAALVIRRRREKDLPRGD